MTNQDPDRMMIYGSIVVLVILMLVRAAAVFRVI
jgi:hypothetical protein